MRKLFGIILVLILACNSQKKDPNFVVTKFKDGKILSKGTMLDSSKIGPWYFYFSESKKVKLYENYDSFSNLLERIDYYPDGATRHAIKFRNNHIYDEYYLKEGGDTQMHFFHLKEALYCITEFHSPTQKSLIGYKVWNGSDNRFYQHGTWTWFNNTGGVMRTKEY